MDCDIKHPGLFPVLEEARGAAFRVAHSAVSQRENMYQAVAISQVLMAQVDFNDCFDHLILTEKEILQGFLRRLPNSRGGQRHQGAKADTACPQEGSTLPHKGAILQAVTYPILKGFKAHWHGTHRTGKLIDHISRTAHMLTNEPSQGGVAINATYGKIALHPTHSSSFTCQGTTSDFGYCDVHINYSFTRSPIDK